jgi:hypothetical protein
VSLPWSRGVRAFGAPQLLADDGPHAPTPIGAEITPTSAIIACVSPPPGQVARTSGR